MLQKFIATGIAMSSCAMAFAQDSTKAAALSITGSADLYYRYDFAKTKANNYTSFTNSHNRFELGMATVKLEHKTEKVDVVADLGFGKRAEEFSYNDDGILAAVKQLYISYSPTSWLKLTAGNWATHVGYELVDAYANRNYSMSYMFSNGPFSHTGVKAEFTSGKSGFMIGVANPTDYKYVPEGVMNKKFLLAQYSYAASDNLKFYLNYVGGQGTDTAKNHQVDAVVSARLSSKFSIGYNGTIANRKVYQGDDKFASSENWWGSALYLNLDPTTHFGLTLRGEYFSDKHAVSTSALGGSVFATTLSANLKVDNFIFIPEFRLENANKEIFLKSSGAPAKTAASFLVAAIYQF
jgi:hypothetical protein